MEGITNEFIDHTLDYLFEVHGIQKPINDPTLNKALDSGNLTLAAEEMARAILLPIKIQLRFADEKTSQEKLNSNTPAQVIIPSSLPLYGTKELINFPIQVIVRRDCSHHKRAFAAIMAHELTHVLLSAKKFSYGSSELCTDLMTMMNGLKDIYERGRKVIKQSGIPFLTPYSTHTTTYGYLDDSQFNFAYSRISRSIREYDKLRIKVCNLIKIYLDKNKEYQKIILKNNEKLKDLDNNKPEKMSKKDAKRIVRLHNIDSFENIEQSLKQGYDKYSEVQKNYKDKTLYKKTDIIVLKKYYNELTVKMDTIKEDLKTQKKDYKIMQRYC